MRRWCAHLTIAVLTGVAYLAECVAEERGQPAGLWIDVAIGRVARWGYR